MLVAAPKVSEPVFEEASEVAPSGVGVASAVEAAYVGAVGAVAADDCHCLITPRPRKL